MSAHDWHTEKAAWFAAFASHLTDGDPGAGFHLIQANGIRGIAKDIEETAFPSEEWINFLVQQHKGIGYILKNQRKKPTGTTIVDQWYLKPSMRLQLESPAEQLYGNISLEMHRKKDAITRIKCQSTYYVDQHFKTVRPFEEWMGVIFGNESFNL